jgi:hypothetical protein
MEECKLEVMDDSWKIEDSHIKKANLQTYIIDKQDSEIIRLNRALDKILDVVNNLSVLDNHTIWLALDRVKIVAEKARNRPT